MLFFNEWIFLAQTLSVAFFAIGSVLFGIGGITSFITLCALLSNLFVRKQIMLFGLSVVASDALSIGSDLGIHLVYEYFGPHAAKKAIWLCLFISLFFIVMAQLFLWYHPNVFDTAQSEYYAILGPMPFIIGTSCLVALATKGINFALYHTFSLWWGSSRFFTKTILALVISQLFDTIAFTILALSGTVHSVLEIIFFSYCVKCCVIFSGVPFVTFCRKFIPLKPFTA